MKKCFLFTVVTIITLQTSIHAAGGGLAPCLATCFLGDSRIGLYMNDGKPIEGMDWLIFGADLAGSAVSQALPPAYEEKTDETTVRIGIPLPLGKIIAGIDAYSKSKSVNGLLAGYFWGRRVGAEIKTTKVRTKEILMCIPIVNIYPCIALPLEAYSGKTMSQVIEEENLKR